jgi:hypothetical protein
MSAMKHYVLLAVLGLAALFAGCSDVADTLGLGRNPPDEFAVVDRPPLALPPDFDLRPPKPGAPRPQEINTAQRASTMLFGPKAKMADRDASPPDESRSDAEKALLESAGAAHADPNIREMVDREAAQKVVGTTHLVDELLWWRKPESSATTVDAEAEAERIKEAKEKGEPVNQGATPVIERRKSSWLGL